MPQLVIESSEKGAAVLKVDGHAVKLDSSWLETVITALYSASEAGEPGAYTVVLNFEDETRALHALSHQG